MVGEQDYRVGLHAGESNRVMAGSHAMLTHILRLLSTSKAGDVGELLISQSRKQQKTLGSPCRTAAPLMPRISPTASKSFQNRDQILPAVMSERERSRQHCRQRSRIRNPKLPRTSGRDPLVQDNGYMMQQVVSATQS